MKKLFRCPELYVLLCLAVLLSIATGLERKQQSISDQMLRLHVVANSDSTLDQSVKLKVRDAVLEVAESMISTAESAKEAKEILSANQNILAERANQTLMEENISLSATVTVQRELFPLREYDTFSLPGGYYDAVRVVIGEGQGHNWWCVVYPSICTPATTEDLSAVAAMAGLEEDEIRLITAETPVYEFRFKILELFEEMMSHLRPMLTPDS